MKGKWSKCYLLIGTIIILVIVAAGSFTFVKSNIEKADSKYSFESIYTNTSIDFIIPSPSYEQVASLENSADTGIEVVTPYYETNTKVQINGSSCEGLAVLIPNENKVDYTPYSSARVLEGKTPVAGQVVVDLAYIEKNACRIGDTAEISIAGRTFSYEIVGIAEENIYSKNGSIAFVLTDEDNESIRQAGITFSAAFVKVADYDRCKDYLYFEYKPYGRLKDQDEFSSEETYNQHVANFEDADWTKEITNCADNYDSLKVKYSSIESAIYRNLIVYSIIILLGILIMNIAFLKSADVQKAMKINIVKKSGTVADAKKFYSSGIWFGFIEFVLASGALYFLVASKSIIGLFGNQLINLGIPIAAALVVSLLMLLVTGIYTGNKYKLKKSEVVAIKKELGIPLSDSEK